MGNKKTKTKKGRKFLFSGIFISILLLSSVTIGGSEVNFSDYYHKVLGYLGNKEDHLKTWLSGRFGASADIIILEKPELNQVPFDIKSVNDDVIGYILPRNDAVISMVEIIPGKSLAQKQEEERIRVEEEARRKAEEEERKKNKVQMEDTGGFCGDSSYRYIEMDLSLQRLALCNFGQNEGLFPISSGSRQYPTPTGHFQVNSKSLRAYSTMYNLYMPYWNSFIGNSYGIHELPEYPNGAKEGANYLGRAVSHGCVRLGVGAAATVYNWAPVGTPVEVHQ